MTIKEALNWGIGELKKAEISEPERSAEVLLIDVLGESREVLFSSGGKKLGSKEEGRYKEYIERRKNRESVWHIIGKVKFYGRDFIVNNDVLVPRPETELLIEEVLKTVNSKQLTVNNVIDIGTGSGAIIITIAQECQMSNVKCQMFATDISKEALEVAKKNAKLHRVEKEIEFLKGPNSSF